MRLISHSLIYILQFILLQFLIALAQKLESDPNLSNVEANKDLSTDKMDEEAKNKLNVSTMGDLAISTGNETNTYNHTSFFDKSINTDAVFRSFYVVLALGGIFLIYIGIKTFRLKRHRAANRYKVIATKGDDRESFFPLAGEDEEDEEIFNASNHQGYT